MNRATGYCLFLLLSACAVSSSSGQNNSKVTPLPNTKPKYVYRTFSTLTPSLVTEYSGEDWELVNTSNDGSSGILRRKYVNHDATKEPLKSLQGKWTMVFLIEYGTNKFAAETGKSDTPPTLTFADNAFTFTQIDKAALKEYTQKGTLQYFLPLNADAGVYAIDLFIEEDKTTHKVPILHMELTSAQTHPYTIVRCVCQIRKNVLVIASGGLEDGRPAKEFKPQNTPAYSRYQK